RRVRELELRLLLLESDRARAARGPEPARPEQPVAPRAPIQAPPPEPAGVGALIPPHPVAPRPPQPVESETVQHPAQTGGFGGSGTRPPTQQSGMRPPTQLNMEQRLGGTWLNRVGALVLTLGIAFFLKYAFDNQWIQPAGRVALGLVAGALLLLVGERLQRAAYRGPAQGVVAVGIAALYLSVYAAFAFYQLVTQPV